MPGKHRRRHSFDFSQGSDEENRRCYDERRKVHFDDQYLLARKRSAKHNSSDIRQMNIDETTTKLKESYQSIDKGLHILRKIYKNLAESKQSARYQNECTEEVFVTEINTLLQQVDELEKSLRKSGEQKREYLDELSRLQRALHEDRMKIEATRENRHDLHEKMNESTKVTREQQITINKLKRDNQNLWKILQDVKKHLLEEDNKDVGDFRKRLPQPFHTRPDRQIECDLFPMRDNDSVASSKESAESCTSSADAMLTEKLNYLVKRSENIQSMIEKNGGKGVSKLNRSFSDDCLASKSKVDYVGFGERFSSSENEKRTATYSREKRIPSENEFGVRCDTKDIIRRCEELEQRVEKCSTKDMRDRLVRQLEEMEKEEARNGSPAQRDEKEDELKKTGKEHV